MLGSGVWQLYHKNASAHSSALVQAFLTELLITQTCQPPPAHIWLHATSGFSFVNLKLSLKERRFRITDEIKENATRQLMAFSKKDFADRFEKWKECWAKCVWSKGSWKGTKVPLY
jgi:hypothetical protein